MRKAAEESKMTEEKYRRMFAFLDEHGALKELVILANSWITMITYMAYPLMLIRLFIDEDERIIKMMAIPFAGFLIVTVARKIIRAERPYEKFDITPLIEKNSKGNSFPSRHVFCIFIIATCFLDISIPVGVLFFALGTFLAAARVASGVHFPRDVIAGAVAGTIVGLVFYIV